MRRFQAKSGPAGLPARAARPAAGQDSSTATGIGAGKTAAAPANRGMTCTVSPLSYRRRVTLQPDNSTFDPVYWSRQVSAVAEHRDQDSFMRIFDYFAPRLRRYLCGLGVASAMAEEMTQEALLRLWQRPEMYDPTRASLTTWLYRVTRNLYVDQVRRQAHWARIQDTLEEHEPEPSQARSTDTESFADHDRLKCAIDGLPAMQARLIRMSYLEAKTHREIADELHMPLGTVKSGIRRAFAKLQLQMGAAS
jgi:RNA polymerase sigma-70 factor (ECF subfamily)